MASSLVQSNKTMKRLESRKSHSWWWDGHIGPKNSRWLADNLHEMDKSVKQMLKLIEEDGDSFAKKAEMYYQKRPELIANVEDFYRMYRSLAERYDHLTGELQKNVPSDLHKSGPRAAGFEFFLGSGGNTSDVYHKEGDDSSSSSDSESDDSSVNNYEMKVASSEFQASDPEERIRMLEEELRITKDSLHVSGKEIEGNGSSTAKIQQLQAKLNSEGREVSKLEERIARLKSSLSDRDHEVRDLKIAVSDAEQKICEMKAEICKLVDERSCLERQVREWESRGRSLEEEMRNVKSETEERVKGKMEELNGDIAERSEMIGKLISEREEVKKEMISLKTEMSSKDELYEEMKMELLERVKGLSSEVEKQRVTIEEGAEEKREAIRQLCFSLDHYRNAYHTLRRQLQLSHPPITRSTRKKDNTSL